MSSSLDKGMTGFAMPTLADYTKAKVAHPGEHMGRLHLMELEDQKWFPTRIRNCMTDLLNFMITLTHIYDPIVPLLHRAMLKAKSRQILDLCSGGAGSVHRVQQILLKNHEYAVDVRLSDLYPNEHAFMRTQALKDPSISYLSDSVDATKVPAELLGFRTLFTSFHHFEPDSARKILGDAVRQERGIAIFEFTERSLRSMLLPLISPLMTLLSTPFLRPFSFERLFFTYLVPIVPAAFLFDGVVSQMRSYTHHEMLKLAQEVDDGRYTWEAGCTWHGFLPLKLSYLIGYKPVPEHGLCSHNA